MMKRLIHLAIAVFFSVSVAQAQTEYAPYYRVADLSVSVDQAINQVSELLTQNGFEVLGSYHPAGKPGLGVLVFTSDQLKQIVIPLRERGIHAAVLRVGFVKKGSKTTVSLTNPDYFFYAYLQDDRSKGRGLASVSSKVKSTFRKMGSLQGFGGSHDAKKLEKYRYMMGMEGFRNPVELHTFNSFQAGVSKIESDLRRKENGCQLVYSIVDQRRQVAIFGIGLMDKEKGEPHFLPIIGEDHAAAMPYEIVLNGKEATMLHGRFRIALHWPDLTMGTFSKIMSTPGDIKDLLEALTE